MIRANRGHAFTAIVLLYAAGVSFVGLSDFGIWDPWELEPADQARRLVEEESVELNRPPLPAQLTGAAFDSIGIREWAGRLPMACFGIVLVVATLVLVWRFAGRSAALYGGVVCIANPLFILNSRQMNGDVIGFAASALIALCASGAVLESTPRSDRRAWLPRFAWATGLTGAIGLAIVSRGVLLGVLPALLAVVITSAIRGQLLPPFRNAPRTAMAWAVTLVAAVFTFLVVRAVAVDADEYSWLLGGRPQGGNPPSFAVALEDVFHSFAPWSAVAVVAFGWMLWSASGDEPTTASDDEQQDESHEDRDSHADRAIDLRLMVSIWATLAYGALTLFTARYGAAPYPAVAGLAAMVGIFFADIERSRRAYWAAAVVASLLALLIVRDYGLYPASPLSAIAIADIDIPEDALSLASAWAAAIGVFVVGLLVSLGASSKDAPRPWPRLFESPMPWLKELWQRGRAFRAWMIIAALGAVGCMVFGAVALAASAGSGALQALSSQGVRAGRALFFVPLGIVAVIWAGRFALVALQRIGRWRMLPVLLAGAAAGGFIAHGYLPQLSWHLSPREVYDTLNALAQPDEPVAEYQISSRAGAYYAEHGEPQQIDQLPELLSFLTAEERRWAMIPADELSAIDRAFRRQAERHLFVPDARNARILLVTNQEVAGQRNENDLAHAVRREVPPNIEHRLNIRFEDKIELLGYDLDLPEGDYVGAGQTFGVTWYWRCLAPLSGGWQVFLHIDGYQKRLNGDHDPVDGQYPVRLWDQGDVIVDHQELEVPRHFGNGNYTMYIGFFSGNNRLEIVEGPKDNEKRARAGVLPVR